MSPHEETIRPGDLVEIGQFTDGLKGQTFSLKNSMGEQVVVKFQSGSAAAVLAGTIVLQKAGADTPAIRSLKSEERMILKVAVARMTTDTPAKATFVSAADDVAAFPHALVQDFSTAPTLKTSLQKERVGTFLTVICDTDFQTKLGRIIAADAFAGNRDRMYAGKSFVNPVLTGWYNAGNTLISSAGTMYAPVAIDNEFSPSYPSALAKMAPYGVHQHVMSLASAATGSAEIEAAALFDKFMDVALKNDPDSSVRITTLKQRSRQAFIDQVSRSATATIKMLLTRGQHWKAQFKAQGISDEALQEFKIRKRILRLLSMGKDPKIALTTTGNPDYQNMILESEFSKPNAEGLLGEALNNHYKKIKLASQK